MIDKNLVQHVAHLAKLEFNEADLEKFTQQLAEIIKMEDELAQVDTTNVKPTTHISRQKTTFRADDNPLTTSRDELLKNVPEQKDGLIKVPAILDNEEE